MTIDITNADKVIDPSDANFVERLGEESWTYIKTVVDVMREPILILDKNLCVIAASEPFYAKFEASPMETEKKPVQELGNGQWNIPALIKLLEDIIPNRTSFKGFEVAHDFPIVGRKVVILNGREIHIEENLKQAKFPPIILLIIEDVTDMMVIAQSLASHANNLEAKHSEESHEMESKLSRLEQEISRLKRKI